MNIKNLKRDIEYLRDYVRLTLWNMKIEEAERITGENRSRISKFVNKKLELKAERLIAIYEKLEEAGK